MYTAVRLMSYNYEFKLLQGRPVNSNREAACFIAKLGGNEIHAEICEKWAGRTKREVSVYVIVLHFYSTSAASASWFLGGWTPLNCCTIMRICH
jgi:hypothetical protein